MVAPLGGRGLKFFDRSAQYGQPLRRSPRGGRGLKFGYERRGNWRIAEVAPLAGVWIEMPIKPVPRQEAWAVAPLAGSVD